MAKSNQAVQLLQTRSTLAAFLEALNGRPGDLDAWLECNNEAEVRAHVLALVKNERAADAEHQAFQRAYDALLDIAKDPITCRHFWDAGRSSLRRELEGQRPFAWVLPGDDTAKGNGWIDARIDGEGEFSKPLFAHPIPPPDVRELVEAADALVKRWDSPLWPQQGHTGEFIARLRAALTKHREQS